MMMVVHMRTCAHTRSARVFAFFKHERLGPRGVDCAAEPLWLLLLITIDGRGRGNNGAEPCSQNGDAAKQGAPRLAPCSRLQRWVDATRPEDALKALRVIR